MRHARLIIRLLANSSYLNPPKSYSFIYLFVSGIEQYVHKREQKGQTDRQT